MWRESPSSTSTTASARPPPRVASITRKTAGARRWTALALQLLGLVAVALAAWRGAAWAAVAAAGAIAATLGWTIRWRPGRLQRRGPPALAFLDTLDLVRRAHHARAAWSVGTADGSLEAAVPDLDAAIRDRGSAIAQLASVDGRVHVVRDEQETYVAVGDFPYGAGVLLSSAVDDASVEQAVSELRRMLAGMRLAEERADGPPTQLLARRLARVAGDAQTLDALSRAGVELVQQLLGRAAALVLLEGPDGAPRIAAVSSGGDSRLVGRLLEAHAPAARAIAMRVPVVAAVGDDIFGPPAGAPERRRSERAGTAYPLEDGKIIVGALVVAGAPLAPDTPPALLGQLAVLLTELGPRLAAAKAVHDAERRAVLDPLTGLRNRGEFQRTLDGYHERTVKDAASLVYVDLDHFKRLNDTLGHAAGDAALKHVAAVLEAAVRDGDLVARIGGEEFAIWLPRATPAEAWEVAERVRDSIARSIWRWSGTPQALTTSCGVASFPTPIGDVRNLPGAADAALYRAKELGRNRVEKAAASH